MAVVKVSFDTVSLLCKPQNPLNVCLFISLDCPGNIDTPSVFYIFVPLTSSASGSGWRAQLQPSPPAQLAKYEFDVLISAAGGKFVPEGE